MFVAFIGSVIVAIMNMMYHICDCFFFYLTLNQSVRAKNGNGLVKSFIGRSCTFPFLFLCLWC